jgi:hypothetical protein
MKHQSPPIKFKMVALTEHITTGFQSEDLKFAFPE